MQRKRREEREKMYKEDNNNKKRFNDLTSSPYLRTRTLHKNWALPNDFCFNGEALEFVRLRISNL